MKSVFSVCLMLGVLTFSGCDPSPRVTVPDVIGLDADDAHQVILDKSLVPYLIEGDEAPETKLEWIVYFQDPAAFRRVPKKSGVELTYYTKIPVEPRLISILGTCLDGGQWMWKEIGGEHYKNQRFYGNRYFWPDYNQVEELGMKVFINIRAEDWRFSPEEQEELSRLRDYVKSGLTEAERTGNTNLLATAQYQNNYKRYKDLILKSVPNEDEIQRAVNEWKNRPGNGGYWTDGLGHEPDISGAFIEERKLFYDTIRKYDPDKQGHPVMEMMNMTEAEPENPNWPYPGWAGAFREDTNNLVLVDCYPGTENTVYWIDWAWEKFIKKYSKKNQVIIQMQAFEYESDMIWTQYNRWKELMASDDWDNPYKSPMGLSWYKDETIRQSEEMQQEIREVIADAME